MFIDVGLMIVPTSFMISLWHEINGSLYFQKQLMNGMNKLSTKIYSHLHRCQSLEHVDPYNIKSVISAVNNIQKRSQHFLARYKHLPSPPSLSHVTGTLFDVMPGCVSSQTIMYRRQLVYVLLRFTVHQLKCNLKLPTRT